MIFQFSMFSLDLVQIPGSSDLEIAAAVVKGRKVKEGVRALVVPGSKRVRDAAMQKGLHHIFEEAGFEWREPWMFHVSWNESRSST